MKNHHFNCHKEQGKRSQHKHPKGAHKKNHSNDEKQLLFELFKHFLRARLEEQGQNQEKQQGEPNQCLETGEIESIDCCEGGEKSGPSGGQQAHCRKFGPFKRGKHHKCWGKHHHGHHKNMNHHGPHHHGIHHHHAYGGHHKC